MEPTGRSSHKDEAPIPLKYLSNLLLKEINTDSLQNLPVKISIMKLLPASRR